MTKRNTISYRKTSEYFAWGNMKQRCLNEKSPSFKRYGGRGIFVCERWLNFENFKKDMGKRPQNKSLERINNDDGYYKENCRWATDDEQMNNTSRCIYLRFKGENKTLMQWCAKLNLDYRSAYQKLRNGLPVERVLSKNEVRTKKVDTDSTVGTNLQAYNLKLSADRRKTMSDMIDNGWLYREVAAFYGISKQRVDQLIKQHKKNLDKSED